jgi:ATP-dependent Clp protease adapter protein ClpS
MVGSSIHNTSVVEAPEIAHPGTGSGGGWVVTVYDNDYNTLDEVMAVLMIATECTSEEAYIETWEVHHMGSSVVHHSGEEECTRIAEIIATIGIRVEVSEEN